MDLLVYALVFAVFGMVAYFTDRHYAARLYRFCYDKWHKDPLPSDAERGFIVGRKTKERVFPAVVLTVFSCVVLRYFGEHDVITLLLKGTFLVFPGFLIGFLLTGLAMREGKTRAMAEKVFKAMDDLESGKMDLKKAAGDVFVQAEEFGQKVVDTVKQKVEEQVATEKESSTANEVKESEVPSVAPTPPKRSLRDALENYRNRR